MTSLFDSMFQAYNKVKSLDWIEKKKKEDFLSELDSALKDPNCDLGKAKLPDFIRELAYDKFGWVEQFEQTIAEYKNDSSVKQFNDLVGKLLAYEFKDACFEINIYRLLKSLEKQGLLTGLEIAPPVEINSKTKHPDFKVLLNKKDVYIEVSVLNKDEQDRKHIERININPHTYRGFMKNGDKLERRVVDKICGKIEQLPDSDYSLLILQRGDFFPCPEDFREGITLFLKQKPTKPSAIVTYLNIYSPPEITDNFAAVTKFTSSEISNIEHLFSDISIFLELPLDRLPRESM